MKMFALATLLLLACAAPAFAQHHLKPHATGVHPKNTQVHKHGHHHHHHHRS